MRKRSAIISFICVVIAAIAIGAFWGISTQGIPQRTQPASLQGVSTSYGFSLQLEPDRRTVKGTMDVLAQNTSKDTLDAIYFHLYPNTFRDSKKLSGVNWTYVLGDYKEDGWIDISNVKKEEANASYHVNDSILKIDAPNWKPGDTVHVSLDFNLHIPVNSSRLSLDEHIVYLGNFLPIRAVYDQNGWNLDPYYPMGDPFYSETSDYKLHVSIPKDLQLATSGTDGEQAGTVKGKFRSFDVEAKKVRDFAMVVMDSEYEHKTDKVGDVTVRSWYRKTDNQFAATSLHITAVQSVDFYSKLWGKYPYPEYDVIRTSGFFGGMEYPGLVYIQGNVYGNANDPIGALDVAHETGHQWWYSLVGNNEVTEPWIDESLTQYATLRYLRSYNSSFYDEYLARIRQGEIIAKTFEKDGVGVGSSVDQFPNWSSYAKLVYNKGADMFVRLGEAVGDDKMDAALKKYFETFEYKNATSSDLINAFAAELGPEVKSYFQSWLNGGTAEFKGAVK
ncbi:M1 family metallopeptidase [Paenibacillus sediminis]|uniref:Peptidase M1 membrane alanine aminopeptidase domain-containing protein n=1 Tax=Paenibacillus sediminis TaxID=664909 RepID=A0ABS4H2W5_9BACL|nr:M1 family metallopeptidase [Paenibacillus sediminis]MBP1936859.1 hypothetical protein [Paenibacillus sediminis]